MKKWMLSILLLLFLVPGKSQDEKPFSSCEVIQPAEFPGGIDNMYKFIRQNICYPETASKDSIQGKVYVEFAVDTTGEIKNIKIKRSIRHDLDSICVEMVKHMPRWQASEYNGKKVKQRYVLPINFKLKEGREKDDLTSITPLSCDELRKKWQLEKQTGK